MQKPMQLLFSILLIISLLMNVPLVFAHTEATNTRYTTEAIRSNTDNKGHIITENVENIELSQEQSIVERTKTLNALAAECNILHHVDESVFKKGTHTARLEDEETLNSYVFLNEDNTKTVYLMDERVKYVDAKGDIHEKDLSLISSPTGFSTASNNIALTIPNDPTNGVVYQMGYIR